MEIKLVESRENKIQFEVHGADHVIMNLLKEKLGEDKSVDFATYSTPHPLIEGFLVTVIGKNPGASVKKAVAAVKAEAKSIKAAFKKAK